MIARAIAAAIVLVCAVMPTTAFALCTEISPLYHGLGGYFACDDRGQVAAVAYSLAHPTDVSTGTEDIACEATFGNPRHDCLTGGVIGDREVTIQSDWGNPGIEGCPVTGDTGDRIVIVVQGLDGQGLVVSIGYSADYAGYLVEAASPTIGVGLACSVRSGAPAILNQTTEASGNITLDLKFETPIVLTDCEPGSLGGVLRTCLDGFNPSPAFGPIYTSVQQCVSNPDLRRSLWTATGVSPDAAGNARVTVTPPASAQCVYVGAAPLIGGVESGAIVGFVTLGGVACGLDLDGDGHFACEDDCDDSNPQVYSGHPEICDNLDNNCDGSIDENLGMTHCGVGACLRSVDACVGGQPGQCIPGAPQTEICNGIDDNCNGVVDDLAAQPCQTGLPGACSVGSMRCFSGAPVCVQVTPPSPELCDGLDNDCDGVTDEDLGTVTCGVGACASTAPACLDGHPGSCVPGPSSPEVCDGVDNDCDGSVDEELFGNACDTGLLGACAAGIETCLSATYQCTPRVLPSTEVCNGIDDDCDGATDEDMGYVICGTGACQRSVAECPSGGANVCTPGSPSSEVCDGVDNNCDGLVDNGLTGCGTTLPPCVNPVPLGHGLGSYFSCADISQVAALAFQLTEPTTVTTAVEDIACESVGNGDLGACLGGGRVGDQHVEIRGDWNDPGVSGCPITSAGPQRIVVILQGTNGQGLVASVSGSLPGTGYLMEMAQSAIPGTSIILPIACSSQNGGLSVVSASSPAGGAEKLVLRFSPPRVFSDCSPDTLGWAAGACTDAFAGTSTLGDIYTSVQPCGDTPDLRRGRWTDTGISAGIPGPVALTVARPVGMQCLHIGATAYIDGHESGGIFSFTTVLGTGCVDGDRDGFTTCQHDCDDGLASVYPGRSELCTNGLDDNCDGLIDDEDTYTCEPLAVVLSSFNATPDDGSVTLAWETALEIDSAGFDILRRDVMSGATTSLNPTLIPATGDVQQGASYSWVDDAAVNGVEYEYLLVEVDTHGHRARHPGPHAVPNPPRPPVVLLAPVYGGTTNGEAAPVFAWSPGGDGALIVEISTDPSFESDAAMMELPISGADRRSGRMSLNPAQTRSFGRLLGASSGSLYWRIVERLGSDRAPVSATYRIDRR